MATLDGSDLAVDVADRSFMAPVHAGRDSKPADLLQQHVAGNAVQRLVLAADQPLAILGVAQLGQKVI